MQLKAKKETNILSAYWSCVDRRLILTVTDLIFLGSKITADSDCRHEIKKCLLLGRKAMTD